MADSPLYNDPNGGQAPDDNGDFSGASASPLAQTAAPAPSAAQAQAQSQPTPPPDMGADAMQPQAPDAQTQAAVQQPQPMVRFQRTVGSTLKGMLIGMLDGGVGGAIAGGVSPTGAQRTADNAASMQNSKVKFASAQAAAMVSDAAIKDKQLHTMDEDHQMFVTNNGLSQLKDMQALGLTPTLVTDNNKGGQAAMVGLQSLTDTHGAVPPMFTINLGHQVVGFDLNQLAAAPQILDEVNKYRSITGQAPMTQQGWAQLPQSVKLDQTNAALSFSNPMPSEANLATYKNYLATAKMAPDSPTKAANVAKLQSTVDGMQKVMDETQARAEHQKIADYKAETPAIVTRAAETASAEARAKAQFDNKPVYAINNNGDTVFTTAAAAQQAGMSGIRPVKETDITKDQHDIKVLSDIQVKANNVAQAAGAMDSTSWPQAAIAAKYLADNPNTPVNTLLKSAALKNATPQLKNYVIAINSLRESSMGLQKVLTGTARTNETQLSALLNTLPGVEPDAGTVKQKLGAFTQNLQLLSRGLPKGTGVELQGFGGSGGQYTPPSAADVVQSGMLNNKKVFKLKNGSTVFADGSPVS
jgi:hypothetical protein